MADNNVATSESLEQSSELCESSLWAGFEHTPEKIDQLPLLTVSGMHLRDEGLNLATEQVDAFPRTEFPDSGEDMPLQPNLDSPFWIGNVLEEHHGLVEDDVLQKSCATCNTELAVCGCKRTVASASPSSPHYPYTDWIYTGQRSSGPEYHSEQLSQAEPTSSNSGRVINQMTENLRGGENSGFSPCPMGTECTNENDESLDSRLKAKVLAHPMFSKLLEAHVGCLRISTPVNQHAQIDEQLERSHLVTEKYSPFAPAQGEEYVDIELDEFMRKYTSVLQNMQNNLQHHVQVHTNEAMLCCSEIEQELYNLTGVTPAPSAEATMFDNDQEANRAERDADYDTRMNAQDNGDYGPLAPTETERSLMNRVRQQLKQELTEEGYRNKLIDVRNEIHRKRRAGKLPEETTTVLKSWWNAHSKWPYPTRSHPHQFAVNPFPTDMPYERTPELKDEEKERLVQETGLEPKQVTNWFINQRKRNRHSNATSSANETQNKRKL